MSSEQDTGQAPGRPMNDDAATVAWTPPPTMQDDAPAAETARVTRRQSRLRWGVAILVTALVVVAAGIAVILLTGSSSPSSLVGYVPDEDAVVYGEMRLDLPGDQRQKLGEFLSKFPGFQDRSTLDAKLDDVMDRIVRAMTDGSQDWTTDVKPWFGGEMAFSVTSLPPTTDIESWSPTFLLLASVKDGASARAWLTEHTADLTTRTDDYNGTSLSYVEKDGHTAAFGIVGGKVLLAGDEATVKASIDGGGKGAFAESEQYRAAKSSLTGDGLGHLYVDVRAYVDWLVETAESMDGPNPLPAGGVDLANLPEWGIVRLRLEGDALVTEGVSPHVEGPLTTENRTGVLAANVPPSTIVLAESHDYGKTLVAMLDQLRKDPETAANLDEIEPMLAGFGGLEGSVSWIGDLGIVVTREGDTVDGGVVATTTDRAKSDSIFSTIVNLISFGGPSSGLDIEVRTEDHAGTTITTVDFGDWADLAARSGSDPSTIPFEGRLQLAYATTDQLVVLGFGPDFVAAVLDAGSGDSLADDARYRSLIDRVGDENGGVAFVDVAALRETLEGLARDAGAAHLTQYEAEVKPYLVPFDALIAAPSLGEDFDHWRAIIVVE